MGLSFSGPFPALESWGEGKDPIFFVIFWKQAFGMNFSRNPQGVLLLAATVRWGVERKLHVSIDQFRISFLKQHVCLASLDSPVHEWKGGLPTSTWWLPCHYITWEIGVVRLSINALMNLWPLERIITFFRIMVHEVTPKHFKQIEGYWTYVDNPGGQFSL